MVKIDIKDLERLRYEALARFAVSNDTLTVLVIKEFLGLLKRKGVDIKLEFEEECELTLDE